MYHYFKIYIYFTQNLICVAIVTDDAIIDTYVKSGFFEAVSSVYEDTENKRAQVLFFF